MKEIEKENIKLKEELNKKDKIIETTIKYLDSDLKSLLSKYEYKALLKILKGEYMEFNFENEYEIDEKVEKKWIFVGWGEFEDERFTIATKEKTIKGNKYIYKTYKYLDGSISEKRYLIERESE